MAEGGGLLNRCRVKSSTGGSNPPLSASDPFAHCCKFADYSQILLPTLRPFISYHSISPQSPCCNDTQATKPVPSIQVRVLMRGRSTTAGEW